VRNGIRAILCVARGIIKLKGGLLLEADLSRSKPTLTQSKQSGGLEDSTRGKEYSISSCKRLYVQHSAPQRRTCKARCSKLLNYKNMKSLRVEEGKEAFCTRTSIIWHHELCRYISRWHRPHGIK